MAHSSSSTIAGSRFWGVVVAVRARLVVTRFEGNATARCHGHLLVIDGTRHGDDPEVPATRHGYVVAIGPATQERRRLRSGDLLRGNAHPVPAGVTPDTPADLFRVGTLHVVARASDMPDSSSTVRRTDSDPPRTDEPLTPLAAVEAPRRALRSGHLDDSGPCARCPYGTIVPVVRLSDPRDYRSGRWSQVPACLGPEECPHFAPYEPDRA